MFSKSSLDKVVIPRMQTSDAVSVFTATASHGIHFRGTRGLSNGTDNSAGPKIAFDLSDLASQKELVLASLDDQ